MLFVFLCQQVLLPVARSMRSREKMTPQSGGGVADEFLESNGVFARDQCVVARGDADGAVGANGWRPRCCDRQRNRGDRVHE